MRSNNLNRVCRDLNCFLYERTGGTCPAARPPGYDPAAAERRIEKISQAIKADAQHVVGMVDLLALDAERQAASVVPLVAAEPAELPRTAAAVDPNERKEKVHVIPTRPS